MTASVTLFRRLKKQANKGEGGISMNFISSLVIILIFAGIFVLMYVIGGIVDAIGRYITNSRKRGVKGTSKSMRRKEHELRS